MGKKFRKIKNIQFSIAWNVLFVRICKREWILIVQLLMCKSFAYTATVLGLFVIWKPQGGHKGPSKKSELKTPKITSVLDGFSKGSENVTKQKYVISEANTYFCESNSNFKEGWFSNLSFCVLTLAFLVLWSHFWSLW